MRLFIDGHYFISIIQTEQLYSCQVMELIHGVGMFAADITEDQIDVVSSIVYNEFSEPFKYCKNLREITEFHLQCLLEIKKF
jgi:hypothetical protein